MAALGPIGYRPLEFCGFVVIALWLASPALPCGQTTHVWTVLEAVDELPPGALRDLLADPAMRPALVGGTMFPDGGYSHIVEHPYGEVSHWEPFQSSYGAWIAASWPGLEADTEARNHLAFLFGLAGHGLGDQLFDASYLLRSQAIDTWGPDGADTATDVVFGATFGGWPTEERWVPYEDLVQRFGEVGVEVDVPTMELGMASLEVALAFVASAATQPDVVAEYEAVVPWANAHLLDPTIPGSPARLPKAIAAYWVALWQRLHGGPPTADLVVHAEPEDGSFALPTDPGELADHVHLVLGSAVDEESVETSVRATANGQDVPVEAWMYYGQHTNVLNIRPIERWPESTTVSVHIDAGIPNFDESWVSSEPAVVTWSTAAEAPEVPAESSGCAAFGGLPLFVFLRRRSPRCPC